MTDQKRSFDQWAIVEIMGHQTYAGRVTEEVIAGSAFVRIDIPTTETQEGFTKFFGPGSIYGITPTTEPIARALAARYERRPVAIYDLPIEWQEKLRQPAAITHESDFGEDIDDEF